MLMHGFFRFEARRPNNENSSGFLESPLVPKTSIKLLKQGSLATLFASSKDSQINYLSPITDDFYAETSLPDETELTTFMSLLDNKGRGRLNLEIEVKQGDQVAMTLKGAYVAVER